MAATAVELPMKSDIDGAEAVTSSVNSASVNQRTHLACLGCCVRGKNAKLPKTMNSWLPAFERVRLNNLVD